MASCEESGKQTPAVYEMSKAWSEHLEAVISCVFMARFETSRAHADADKKPAFERDAVGRVPCPRRSGSE